MVDNRDPVVSESLSPPPRGGTAGSSVPQGAGASAAGPRRAPRPIALAGPVALLALAAYVLVESLQLTLWTGLGPGPGFFPCVLGALLGVLCLVWLGQMLRAGADAAADGEAVPVRSAATVLVSLVLLAALMGVLGFQLSVFAFLLFHLRWRAHRGWPLSLGLSLAGSFGVFAAFTQGLLVFLPQSSIPALSNLGL